MHLNGCLSSLPFGMQFWIAPQIEHNHDDRDYLRNYLHLHLTRLLTIAIKSGHLLNANEELHPSNRFVLEISPVYEVDDPKAYILGEFRCRLAFVEPPDQLPADLRSRLFFLFVGAIFDGESYLVPKNVRVTSIDVAPIVAEE